MPSYPESQMSKPVGIIGSACRFPGGADSPSKLWELLNDPRDVLCEFPPDRLNLRSFYHPNGDHHGSTDVQNKSYLLTEDIRLFDASFFRVSPSEADCMDPQQRLLLETVYEALEAAGCSLDRVKGSLTAVYAGLMNGDFADLQGRDIDTIPQHHGTGTHRSILSNRVSYFLDLKGPSMTIDTACSSSLVALHQAVQSLRSGESDMAIVAGANLILDPTMYVAESKLHMLSPDSRSRMWDAAANGYARGEGFAAVVLKPLSRAIRDRDHVECVIRGSAVNSDGRTAGITVPSASAQTALIQRAYRDAGLDPLADRCQFFEAHGTGTRAGDPVEARAIRDAFFPSEGDHPEASGTLLVGSIKTVLGHLEGCAGLAGVLKASLAMQNRTIPPNLHFSELNPDIVPFYDHLEIPVKASRWPELPANTPLRVSVNCFGFGGTNAHVILESFEADEVAAEQAEEGVVDERFVGPLIISANSRDSLVRSVRGHADYIRNNDNVNLGDLSWTLQFRRTQFGGKRVFFSGATRQELLSYMDNFVAENAASKAVAPAAAAVEKSPPVMLGDDGPTILGVFTGQGAQWKSMGSRLIRFSPVFRESIAKCEASLALLGSDSPAWSLREEILAEGDRSRVEEPAISQPLCTAIQIGLVDLLSATGIALRSTVGHSSGEIAAVYAAGIISAHDAIRIAYYRGFHAALAQGPNGRKGAMLAAGLTLESATEICEQPEYQGRVVVAAVNSPSSVTISGDADAIDELKDDLDAKKMFARKLNVGTAYHSHHMQPCADAYLDSLKRCNIQVHRPNESCVWISSVRGDADLVMDLDEENEDEDADEEGLNALKAQYWVDNLLQTVLFAPALECSLWRAGPFDIAAEVGPHPALKGPSSQLLKALLGSALPYFGLMRRDDDEIVAFSGGLGYLWEHFGAAALIDFEAYRRAFDQPGTAPRLLKGLPSYCWDHGRVHWRESRISQRFRTHDQRTHEILGRRVPDDTPELLRWRNILRPSEVTWARDHAFQGDIVIPGATFVAAIMEAASVLAEPRPIKLIEFSDLSIPKALVLQENKSVELLTSLGPVVAGTDGVLSAEFSFSSTLADASTAARPERTCVGRVVIHLDELDPSFSLPLPGSPPPNLSNVDIEAFYTSLANLGIDYQGSFRAMRSAQRTVGYASTLAAWNVADLGGDSHAVHPAVLDVGLQSVLAAIASPQTGQMWTMYLPVAMRRVTIHPQSLPPRHRRRHGASGQTSSYELSTRTSAHITSSSAKKIVGDVQIMFGSSVGVQVEGVELRAMGDPLASGDRVLFSNNIWESDISTGIDKVVLETPVDPVADDELFEALGRTSLYYYQVLLDEISPRECKSLSWHQQMFWQSARHWVDEVQAGRHPSVKKEWLQDTRDAIWKQAESSQNTIDIQLSRSLGEKLTSIARGETQPLEVMMEDNMLSRFYVESRGLGAMNDHIARAVAQITHRHPKANILEIGAGSGGTTRKTLLEIGNTFGHYTFTDISSGFFEKGAARFSQWQRKMTFKVCDIEKDPIEQGFGEGAYDIIVAANVLHATRCLSDTMRHVRRLLKPGGYLVMMEITGDLLRLGFIMGPLPGWWLGPQLGDEGRQWAPGLSIVQWDELLRRTGFSGVDHMATDNASPNKHYVSTLISQAVDDKFALLRSPLADLALVPTLPHKLVILGGETLPVANVARDIKKVLAPWKTAVETVASLDRVSIGADEKVSLLSLTELDQPLFATQMSASRLERLQMLLNACSSVLWVTAGCRASSPTSNMFVGFARALRTERNDISLQVLDVASPSDANAATLAESFLRLALVKQEDHADGPPPPPRLWTTEPEVALDKHTLLIPRLIPDRERNERYNASRRAIGKEVDLADTEVEVETAGGVVTLLGVDSRLTRGFMAANPEQLIIDVRLSVALTCPDQHLFLCCGTVRADDGQKAFALSRTNRSVILCSPKDALLLDSTTEEDLDENDEAVLDALAAQLIARSFASSLPKVGGVLVYEPPSESLPNAFRSCSLWKSRQIYFATSRTHVPLPSGWILINTRALRSSIRRKISDDVSAVIDFSSSGSSITEAIDASDAVIRRFEPSFLETDGQALRSAHHDALAALGQTGFNIETRALSLHSLSGSSPSILAYPARVDWRAPGSESITVHVKPLSPAGTFSSSKTHFMVGLNGDLGQSICAYMIRNGARHIAIASRSGQVNKGWLDNMRNDHGADVRVYKMDVSSQKSIRRTLDQIRGEMPPIGGVANGALVLQDKMFLNMDVQSLNGTLESKVDGSRHLDDIFSAPGLDYFVLFSSAGTVGNNRGQSNYHAANMFMTSLVANRRNRGLAASVIHVGMILDVGYVARQDRKLFEHMRKQGFMPTSETDAHCLWAEGVLASPADSQLNADICMGFNPFQDCADELSRPPWYHDARLSHFITQPEEEAGDDRHDAKDTQHIRQKLDGVESLQEAHGLIREAFSRKLESMMQLDSGTVNCDIPLLDLGFDSLLAVETRTWFLKDVHVDVPVLRLLSGDTITEICRDAATQYLTLKASREAEPKHDDADADDGDAAAASAPAPAPISVPASASASASTQQLETGGKTLAAEEIDTPLSISTASSSDSEQLDVTAETSSLASLDAQNALEIPASPATTAKPTSSAPTEGGTMASLAHYPAFSSDAPARDVDVRDVVSRTEAMSYAQARLWFLGQYLEDATTCNITIQYAIKGLLDVDKLRRALAKVVAHHASLRTCFYVDEETGEPVQGLLRAPHPSASLKCLKGSGDGDAARREFDALRRREWDLAHGETFAATLLSSERDDDDDDDDEHIILFGYHHIVIDGVSWATILRDLDRAYASKPLSRQRKLLIDASVEQRRAVESGALDGEFLFWERLYAELPETLPLLPVASAQNRRQLQRYHSHTVTRDLGSHLVARVKSTSRALGVTPFHLYLTAMQVLLHKLLDLDDLCIGVTDAGRDGDGDGDLADTVGFFVNMLPLRFKLDRKASLADLARKTFEHVLEARRNGHVPVDAILDRVRAPRDSSFNPLFQVTFNYRAGAMANTTLGDCSMSVESSRDSETPFDLGFGVYESANGSSTLQVIMQSSLYDSDAAECVGAWYVNLLETLCADTSRTLMECDVFEACTVQNGLSIGRGTRRIWAWPHTLSERVDDMIRSHGDQVAVIDDAAGSRGEQPVTYVTYEQLERRIRLAASAMLEKGAVANSPVAVLCRPSVDLIVSMLAILRLGHVYVPLDTNLPRERHAAILVDCEASILVCHAETLPSSSWLAADLSVINLSDLSAAANAPSRPEAQAQADLYNADIPAFLFYTSGSTGKPKGIQLSQSGFSNHIALKSEHLSLGREVVLQQSSVGFDMSLTQIFAALANGGTVVVAPQPSRGDPVALSQLMVAQGVTLTVATPSEYAVMLRYCREELRRCQGWKNACMGGEVVTEQLVQAFAELGKEDLRLTNCYGPTETSLAVTFEDVSPRGGAGGASSKRNNNSPGGYSASVGRVLPNNSVYILEQDSMQPVPTGIGGEICIGGAGVAKGYLHRPDLSKAKFVPDPFANADEKARGWTHMFRTGDRGRLRSDGSLVFMGRLEGESMVKLRGLRIDLDDVANTMVREAGAVIAEAVVTVRGGEDQDSGQDDVRTLVAHVVPRAGQEQALEGDGWREVMRRLPLPAYMRPSVVVTLKQLPRTPNGKVDRREMETASLAAAPSSNNAFRAKLSLEEGELSLLWEEVLAASGGPSTVRRADLRPDSDFFMVGGSSLLLMRLQGAIKEMLGLAVPMVELYRASTLGSMAAHLGAKRTTTQQQQGGRPMEEIDWQRETEFALPASVDPSRLRSDAAAAAVPMRAGDREILLTGAHTMLGSRILQALVDDSSVRRVHCVSVPASTAAKRVSSRSSSSSSKISYYPGSLQSETLGLSPDDVAYLQGRIDAIVHAGSQGHCLNNYSSIRSANVGSLRFLVGLALDLGRRRTRRPKRPIPVHFVSSSRVTLLSGSDRLPPVSVGQHQPPRDWTEGFTASKWAGERLLERVSAATGLDVTVHRPCAVVGPDAPTEDALNSLLRFADAQSSVPRFDKLAGYLDFAPVDEVGRSVADVVLQKQPGQSKCGVVVNMSTPAETGAVRFVHYSGGVETPVAEFRRRMETMHAREFGELDMADWIAEAVRGGMDPLISTYLEALLEKDETMVFPYLGSGMTDD